MTTWLPAEALIELVGRGGLERRIRWRILLNIGRLPQWRAAGGWDSGRCRGLTEMGEDGAHGGGVGDEDEDAHHAATGRTHDWEHFMANVAGLRWSEVDVARSAAWGHADEAKGGEAIGVPLNDGAMAVLNAETGKHPERVFTYRGRPLGRLNTRSWRNALKRAGIENFRWHDLRHVWATWHVMAGTMISELQELGAWKSELMVKRDAHSGRSSCAQPRQNLLRFRLQCRKAKRRSQWKLLNDPTLLC